MKRTLGQTVYLSIAIGALSAILSSCLLFFANNTYSKESIFIFIQYIIIAFIPSILISCVGSILYFFLDRVAKNGKKIFLFLSIIIFLILIMILANSKGASGAYNIFFIMPLFLIIVGLDCFIIKELINGQELGNSKSRGGKL